MQHTYTLNETGEFSLTPSGEEYPREAYQSGEADFNRGKEEEKKSFCPIERMFHVEQDEYENRRGE